MPYIRGTYFFKYTYIIESEVTSPISLVVS